MIYFTADNHFCHFSIIKHCQRPFLDERVMNNEMIHRWNSVVKRNDEIYILGDFIYKGKGKDANEILSRLNGKKYLIKGNHEKYLDDKEFNYDAFEWVKDYYVLSAEDLKIVLFHFPILSWYNSHHNSIHLYGHVHNSGILYPEFGETLKVLGKRAINVGVDVNDFYPVSIYEIKQRVFPKTEDN
jgi:calcineurin-like phosphoesterase family protein